MVPSAASSTLERVAPLKGDQCVYECTVLLSPGISPEEVKNVIKDIAGEVAGFGGEVRETDLWGRRGLAYDMRGSAEAFFAVLLLALPPAAVGELSRSIRIMKPVLRHLLLKPEPGYVFVRYSEKFEQWQQERVQREREQKLQQEEKLKQQILKKAAAPKMAPVRRTPSPGVVEESKVSIEKQLEEIISDENLHI